VFVNFDKLINFLPQIIFYFLPGFIFIYIKNYLLSKDTNEDNHLVIKSFIGSYILINFFIFLFDLLSYFVPEFGLITNTYITENPLLFFLLLIFSSVLSFVTYKIIISEYWYNTIKHIGINKTNHSIIWEDVIDLNNGAYLRVYIDEKEIMYDGKLIVFENNGKENYFIALSNYVKYKNKKKIENYRNDDEKIVLFNTGQISRYEVFKN